MNQTNGQYPDSQVYWSFNGQTESIAQQPYIDMPANSAGRMYFYLGTPNGPYYDFIEFTVGASSINVDTTRVDRFGLKLALLLHGHDGSNQEVGENYATFQESRAATFARFENFVPTQFKELATDDAPYGIPSPGNDPAFQTGGAYANYFTSYAAAVGDTSDSTAQIFGCGGTLAGNPHAVRRAQPARRAAAGGAAVEPGQLLPGRPGELLRRVLAPERDQRQAVRLPLRRLRRAVLGHLGDQPAVHGRRRRLVTADHAASPTVPAVPSARRPRQRTDHDA